MRITSSMYYRSMSDNGNQVNKGLFDVNRQISSGRSIQYAYEDTNAFINTLRLDDEIVTHTQIKQSSMSAYKFSTQSDTVLNEFSSTLDSFKVKLIAAANDTQSEASRKAIVSELKGLREHLITLSNTSINGNYLFSGSAIDTKPISEDGSYNGNGEDLKAFFGDNRTQVYNVSGEELFYGQKSNTNKVVTLNVPRYNQTKLHPDVMSDIPNQLSEELFIKESDTIRDLMGDDDAIVGNNSSLAKYHFYIQGRDSQGVSFKETLSLKDDDTVSTLLNRIGDAFGNIPTNKVVDVTLNSRGEIEIKDLKRGSSKLDFSMVANINDDPALPNTDANGASLDIADLNSNGTKVISFMRSDFTQFVSTLSQRQDLYNANRFELAGDYILEDGSNAQSTTKLSDLLRSDVASIVFSGTDSSGAAVNSSFNVTANATLQDLVDAIDAAFDANISGNSKGDLLFDIQKGRINFSRADGFAANIDINLTANNGANGTGVSVDGLPSDASIVYDEVEFAKSDNRVVGNVSQIVKSDNSYATFATKLVDVASVGDLTGETLVISGLSVGGNRIDINFNFNAPVTYDLSINGGAATTYSLYNADVARTATQPNEVSYQQLMDVINISFSDTPRSGNTATDLDNDIQASRAIASTTLDSKGRILFEELNVASTAVELSIADINASDMTANGSILTFNSNNAIAITDPKLDFFETIDRAIAAVDANDSYPNEANGRNIGIQNAIATIDELAEHTSNVQSKVGAYSNTLLAQADRRELLIISTKSLQSEFVDTDIAEASLRLNQLSLNYQAMMSTISRISQLSLVNYL